jgi:hypothetical protein
MTLKIQLFSAIHMLQMCWISYFKNWMETVTGEKNFCILRQTLVRQRHVAIESPTHNMHPTPTAAKLRIASICLTALLSYGSPASFAADTAHEIVVTINLLELPSSRQAQAILSSESRFLWEQQPLRSGLQDLSQVHGISIWIDRGLDPTQLVSTAAPPEDSSLQNRLLHIAKLVGAEVGLIENVVYFGPATNVARMQRAAVELHNDISRAGSERTAQLRPWKWSELTSSAEMLAQLASQWNIKVSGEIPHDLYHAGELRQPTTLATQLTLLLGGFEQQAVWTAPGRFEFKLLDARTRWQASYRKSDIDLRNLARLKSEYSGSNCLTRGEVSQVSGVTNFHLALLAPRTAKPAAGRREATSAWGFEVKQTPVEAVLEKLASSLGFELNWDEACTQEMRQQRISFKVDGATTDQLLAEVARVSQLKIVRDKQRVMVKP